MHIYNFISEFIAARKFHSKFVKYAAISALLTTLFPGPSFGQGTPLVTRSTLSFSNPNIPDGTGAGTCSGNEFLGNFMDGSIGTIKDLNVTVAIAHPVRNQLRIQLQRNGGSSPLLTLMDQVGGGADNLNVLFDDSAPASITTHTNGPDNPLTINGTNGSFRPFPSALGGYIGLTPGSSWTLHVCDPVFSGGVVGTVDHAYLDITRFGTDLSLTKTVSNPTPMVGETITYLLTVTSSASSEIDARFVGVAESLPAGLTLVSATPAAGTTYSGGIWSVGTLPPGQSRTLSLSVRVNGTVTPGSVINDPAEIRSSSEPDTDSVPNNGVTTEDDYASVSLTILNAPGTPPDLANNTCRPAGVGMILLDWDSFGWVSGANSRTANLPGIGNISFNVTTNTSFASPLQVNDINTGGGPRDGSLHQNLIFPPGSRRTITNIILPTAVPGAQFTIFDVDGLPASVRDMITVTGSFGGNNIFPILTNGVTHIVSGNQATGFTPSNAASADGNLVVTFNQPVDTIIITYDGINAAASGNPAESVSLYDFLFCEPTTTLTVTKTSTVLNDFINASNFKAIPDAVVQHCITITNDGIGTAQNVIALEPLDTDIRHIPDRIFSGTNCASATTAETETPLDPVEPDGISAGFLGETIRVIIYTLAPGEGRAVTYESTIQ